MKTIKYIITTCCIFLTLTACDNGFEELNINPNAINDLDASIIFAGSQTTVGFGGWTGEATIAQYFYLPYNLGGTAGFNFNQSNSGSGARWGNYTGPIKNLIQALDNIGTNPDKANLRNMMRIWKAYIFLDIVDSHGNAPYSEAGRAYLSGDFAPVYDDDEAIYEDLYKEIREATNALNPSGDIVSEDFFYNGDITKWKRFGNSLLLRMGMRYSKLNPTKAASIVLEAYNAGVMQTNADDCILFYEDPNLYSNNMNGISNNNPYFYYIAEPIIDQFQLTEDPRSKYYAGKYPDPNTILANPPDVTLSEQQGFPIGYDNLSAAALPDFPGIKGSGLDYSQPNYFAVFSLGAPRFYFTNSQTKLLLAEAALRGWIPGGSAQAQIFYEAGIRASMDQHALYPGPYGAISTAEQNAYITGPEVAFNATDALRLINTEYWVSNFNNPKEGWANFRRTGFPNLSPNLYNNNLNGGFVRRLPYPTSESGTNPDNYVAARAAMGVTDIYDAMTARVFWDVE